MASQYSPAVELLAEQHAERAGLRTRWINESHDLNFAHETALSVLASAVKRNSGKKFHNSSKSIDGRLSLIAQFIQGVDLCETSISEGMYSQAAALLKQELETVTAIDEYERGTRREGKTPNISGTVLSGFGPIYGDLNDIAHVARHDIAVQLVAVSAGDLRGPSSVPRYNAGLARFLYGNHIYFIIEVGKQACKLFEEVYGAGGGMTDKEKDWFFVAMTILLKEEVLKLPNEIQERFPGIDLAKFFAGS